MAVTPLGSTLLLLEADDAFFDLSLKGMPEAEVSGLRVSLGRWIEANHRFSALMVQQKRFTAAFNSLVTAVSRSLFKSSGQPTAVSATVSVSASGSGMEMA